MVQVMQAEAFILPPALLFHRQGSDRRSKTSSRGSHQRDSHTITLGHIHTFVLQQTDTFLAASQRGWCVVFHRLSRTVHMCTVWSPPRTTFFPVRCIHFQASLLAGNPLLPLLCGVSCRRTPLARRAHTVWQRGHLAGLCFLRYENSIVFPSPPAPLLPWPFRTFSLTSRLQSVYCPLITGIQTERESTLMCCCDTRANPDARKPWWDSDVVSVRAGVWARILKRWFFNARLFFCIPS